MFNILYCNRDLGFLWWQGEFLVFEVCVDYEVFRQFYRDGVLDNCKIQFDIFDGRLWFFLEIGGVSGFGVNELVFWVQVYYIYLVIKCFCNFMCGYLKEVVL